MTPNEVVRRSSKILKDAGLLDHPLASSNFLDYADLVKDVIGEWSKRKRGSTRWLKDFLYSLKEMRDDFEAIVTRDPACIYKPANQMALDFHQSDAKIRYIFGGNRISKTESCAVDNYWIVTRQHPYRPLPPVGAGCFIIGSDYTNYAPKVFEQKYIFGEAGNPLSPLFPENGKWFNHYDPKKHILRICCPECAENGTAQSCPSHHARPEITLFSDYGKPTSIAGAQYAQGQFDEQIDYGFFAEGWKRTETVPNSGLVVSETPVYGKAWWTYSSLYLRAKKSQNVVPGTSRTLVSLHNCTQFEGGLVPHEEIYASMELMNAAEIEARVYGRHVAASEQAVFDLVTLQKMYDECKEAVVGALMIQGGTEAQPLYEDEQDPNRTASALLGKMKARDQEKVKFRQDEDGSIYIYEFPLFTEQYIVSADVAEGLTKGDPSCAHVYKLVPSGFDLQLEQVARFYGWSNASVYAEALMKLSIFYNSAWLAVERNGPGVATIQKLKELGYWSLYHDINDQSAFRESFDARYGISTNHASKPVIVSMLQSVIKDKNTGRRNITIREQQTLEEMENFVQEPSESGRTFLLKGLGTFHDDEVMASAIAVYCTKTNPDVFDFNLSARLRQQENLDTRDEHTKKFWRGLNKQQRRKQKWKRKPLLR